MTEQATTAPVLSSDDAAGVRRDISLDGATVELITQTPSSSKGKSPNVASAGSNAPQTLAEIAATYTDEDVMKLFQIAPLAELLNRHAFTRVALQFPDELLPFSTHVVALLERLCGEVPGPSPPIDAEAVQDQQLETTLPVSFAVLADTSYGSCCLDEVAAQHHAATCLVHFGASCLSKPTHIPSIIVLGETEIDTQACADYIRRAVPRDKKLLLLSHTLYYNATEEVAQQLKADFPGLEKPYIERQLVVLWPNGDTKNAQHASVQPPSSTGSCGSLSSSQCCGKNRGCHVPAAATKEGNAGPETTSMADNEQGQTSSAEADSTDATTNDDLNSSKLFFGRQLSVDVSDVDDTYVAVFIGPPGQTLSSMIMTLNKCQFHTFNPAINAGRLETINVNRALMKRYFLVQKLKDANTVGIVAGTLGVSRYMMVIKRIKTLLRLAGKKYYVFLMGKLNDAKMANFAEVDAYVLVSCPETGLLDNHDLFIPVVTPFELELACAEGREWTGRYETDFQRILEDMSEDLTKMTIEQGQDEEQEPHFSMITGRYHASAKDMSELDGRSAQEDLTMVPRSDGGALQPYGAQHLAQRSWRGLEQKLGETPVSKAVQGRRGIAIAYEQEPDTANAADTTSDTP